VDLGFVRELTQRPGPFATAYLDASHDTEDAVHAGELRWSQARAELAGAGADDATLAALDRAVAAGEPPVRRAGRVLVAAGGEVVVDRLLPEPPAVPRARWGARPDLLPLLLEEREPVGAVVVRVDETGGEILVSARGEPPREAETVEGGDYPVHKVRGGGWSHLAMQERVEESWRRNTAAVAERVDAHVVGSGARVVVLAGDPRSRSRLRDALGERAAKLAVDVEHSGSIGPDDIAAAVDAAVLDVVDADRSAVLDRFDQDVGRDDGLAVEGIDAVLAALRARAVETLLVDGGTTRDTTVWISDSPSDVATGEGELRAFGVEATGTAAVDDAMVCAAAATGAEFVPIGGGRTGRVGRPIADGVGAILRFPLPRGS
jgi:hypothetical protein